MTDLSPDDIDMIARSLRLRAGRMIRTLHVSWEDCIFHGTDPDRARKFLAHEPNQRELALIDRHVRLAARLTGERRDIVYEDIAIGMSNADLDVDDARDMTSWAERNTRTPEEAREMDE